MSVATGTRLPRSYLFVPGDRPERFAKALASGADAVVLDLEDAVLPAAKAGAREAVAAFLRASDQRHRIVLRINDRSTPWHAADVDMLGAAGIEQVLLPKAEQPDDIERLRTAAPTCAVLALVETARGVLAAPALAATPGVARLVFGTVDFALDMDLPGDAAGLDHAAGLIALASRAAGIAAPVAGVTTAIDDEAQLLADFARARAFGFGAKLCIHPRQVAPVHAALQPTSAEQAWARRVVEAAMSSPAAGAVQVDGHMIDRPVIERARRLLWRCAH